MAFLLLLAWAEQEGLSRFWLGPIFLFSTVMMYAAIGISSRTTDPEEYYVAGRRIPAMYNGMAAAADWMSAASFISLAGGLYLQGFSGTERQPGGLAYVLGWTGGFCLVALLVAPYLRRLGLYTVPDYFHLRYGGDWPRRLAALAAIICSFTYVVAQIYGIGLIASRLTGVQFEIGILLGLGGVLLCSFLGGMRAITWTQVAQYVVLLLAFLIPVSWLAYKQLGNPMAPLVYGKQLAKIAEMERQLVIAPEEREVQHEFLRRAADYKAKLADVDAALAARARGRARAHPQAQGAGRGLRAHRRGQPRARGPAQGSQAARELWTRQLDDACSARSRWAGCPRMARPSRAIRPARRRSARPSAARGQLPGAGLLPDGGHGGPAAPPDALLHHADGGRGPDLGGLDPVLRRPAVPERAGAGGAGEVRGAAGPGGQHRPAAGVDRAVGEVDPSLISVTDVNGDGRVQFGEIHLGADIIMLATPEIGGCPTWCRAWLPPAGWRRRCPRRTDCC